MRLILTNFAKVIKTNIDSGPQSVGVDISRQERLVNDVFLLSRMFWSSVFYICRFNKCMSCYSQLVPIKAFVLKRQAVAGKMGQTFRELHILLQVFDWIETERSRTVRARILILVSSFVPPMPSTPLSQSSTCSLRAGWHELQRLIHDPDIRPIAKL